MQSQFEHYINLITHHKRSYNKFDEESKASIRYFVNMINTKYGKHYDPETAHGIQDDGTITYIYIGLHNDEENKTDWYFIEYFERVETCDEYYSHFTEGMTDDEITALKRECEPYMDQHEDSNSDDSYSEDDNEEEEYPIDEEAESEIFIN